MKLVEESISEAQQKYNKDKPCGEEIKAQMEKHIRRFVAEQAPGCGITAVSFTSDVDYLADLLNNEPLGEIPDPEYIAWLTIADFALAEWDARSLPGFSEFDITRV